MSWFNLIAAISKLPPIGKWSLATVLSAIVTLAPQIIGVAPHATNTVNTIQTVAGIAVALGALHTTPPSASAVTTGSSGQ